MKTYYSTNEENYPHSDIDDAVDDLLGSGNAEVGDKVTIYKGEGESKKASAYYWADTIENMLENGYEEAGEYADYWSLDQATSEQKTELEDEIKKVIDIWADKHNMHPRFYNIENQEKILVEILNESCDYKVVA